MSRPGRSHHTMVDFNLIAQVGIDDTDVDALLNQAGAALAEGNMDEILAGEMQSYSRGKILSGKVVGKAGDDAVVDVGLKSEGLVNKNEFDNWDELSPGDEIEVKASTSSRQLATRSLDETRMRTAPAWMNCHEDSLRAEVNRMPTRDEIGPGINEQLIVEFYSR